MKNRHLWPATAPFWLGMNIAHHVFLSLGEKMKKIIFLVLAFVSRSFANDFTSYSDPKLVIPTTHETTLLRSKMKDFLKKFRDPSVDELVLLKEAEALDLMIKRSDLKEMLQSHETEIAD